MPFSLSLSLTLKSQLISNDWEINSYTSDPVKRSDTGGAQGSTGVAEVPPENPRVANRKHTLAPMPMARRKRKANRSHLKVALALMPMEGKTNRPTGSRWHTGANANGKKGKARN